MIIIAFSDKTSKLLPRIFCKKIKHVAPIIVKDKDMFLYQFISKNRYDKIPLQMRDLKVLGANGWKFIYLPISAVNGFEKIHAITCVQFTKNAIGIKNRYIQTPNGLYEHLRWNN